MGNKNAGGGVYNVGSDEEITIEALADLIIEKTDSNSKKKFISYEAAYGKAFDDMVRRVPNLSRIKEMTGYRPETTLEQTLEIIVDYFREIDG